MKDDILFYTLLIIHCSSSDRLNFNGILRNVVLMTEKIQENCAYTNKNLPVSGRKTMHNHLCSLQDGQHFPKRSVTLNGLKCLLFIFCITPFPLVLRILAITS